MISAWCREQLAIWMAKRPKYSDVLAEFKHINENNRYVRLFEFRDGDVKITPKSEKDEEELLSYTTDLPRHEIYRRFFCKVVNERQPAFEGTIAMFMEDGSYVSESAPFFSFQKRRDEHSILINDIDAVAHNFYEEWGNDEIQYGDKKNLGIFVGATTGGAHTAESVRALKTQRVRSALYFRDSPLVHFLLPKITQCAEPEAEDLLREMGFGGPPVSWSEQFAYKFLLSMDGNGATCSRVALALKSNSVLLKYKSDSVLYYFSGLLPWNNFIPISHDADVLDIVKAEINRDGLFAEVATEGRRFYKQFLSRDPSFDYASQLFEGYYASFDRPPARRSASPAGSDGLAEQEIPVFGVAHVATVGDVDAISGDFGRPQSGLAIEGVRIFSPVRDKRKAQLEYAAISDEGREVWVQGGLLAGTTGEGRPLFGLRLRASENQEQACVCRVVARFTDGLCVDTGYDINIAVLGVAPLESFQAYVKFLPA